MNRFKQAIQNKNAGARVENTATSQAESTKNATKINASQPNKEQNIAISDIFNEFSAPAKRRGKTTSIYLNDDVSEVIETIATENNISVSKVIDTTLRRVLLTNKGRVAQ